MTKLYFFAYILFFFINISCSRTEELENQNIIPTSVDVFVFGNDNNRLCYWKNGKKTYLLEGENHTADFFGIDNNIIYACGIINQTKEYSYWKNNVKTNLNQYLGIPAGQTLYLNSFFLKDGNIFCGGIIYNPNTTTNEKYEYSYWKNNEKNTLFKSSYSNSKVITLSVGNDVYAATDDGLNYGYYKNTQFIPLVDERVKYFFEHQGNVYFVGYEVASDKYFYKNTNSGLKVNLPNPYFKIFSQNGNLHLADGTKYYFNSLNNIKINTSQNDKGEIISLDALGENYFAIFYGNVNGTEVYKVFINNARYMQSSHNELYTHIVAIQN